MYLLSELTREIDEVLLGLNSQKKHPDWITQMVMARHPHIAGVDSEFYACTGRAHVRDCVRQRLNRYKLKAEATPDTQIVLDGFERLQRDYLIDEDGTQVAVPVHEMTDAQLEAKATELRAMGAGCYQHADEIERYRSTRRDAA